MADRFEERIRGRCDNATLRECQSEITRKNDTQWAKKRIYHSFIHLTNNCLWPQEIFNLSFFNQVKCGILGGPVKPTSPRFTVVDASPRKQVLGSKIFIPRSHNTFLYTITIGVLQITRKPCVAHSTYKKTYPCNC